MDFTPAIFVQGICGSAMSDNCLVLLTQFLFVPIAISFRSICSRLHWKNLMTELNAQLGSSVVLAVKARAFSSDDEHDDVHLCICLQHMALLYNSSSISIMPSANLNQRYSVTSLYWIGIDWLTYILIEHGLRWFRQKSLQNLDTVQLKSRVTVWFDVW